MSLRDLPPHPPTASEGADLHIAQDFLRIGQLIVVAEKRACWSMPTPVGITWCSGQCGATDAAGRLDQKRQARESWLGLSGFVSGPQEDWIVESVAPERHPGPRTAPTIVT